MRKLEELLRSVDHKSYPAYKSLKGSYRFPKYVLHIDHVQGDPFAAPSSLRLELPAATHGIPAERLHGICSAEAVDRLVGEGALERVGDRYRIPEDHFFVSDEIIRELV